MNSQFLTMLSTASVASRVFLYSLLLVLGSSMPAQAFNLQYRVTDLGTFGGTFSQATALNDKGQVVGRAFTGFNLQQHAFIWESIQGLLDLGTFGGNDSFASALNDNGQVAGKAFTASNQNHAFFWDNTQSMVDLGTLGGATSEASALNANGQVAGKSTTAGNQTHAFFWDSTQGMVDLGTIGGATSEASALNANSQVVGKSTTAGNQTHAFFWDSTQGMVDLGTLGGVFSDALGINSNGQVVGNSTKVSGQHHAVLWDSTLSIVDLNTLGGDFSLATALNVNGQVVGHATTTGNIAQHAFFWDSAQGMVDLGTLGGVSSTASALNASGQVVGQSTITATSNQNHAFLWNQTDGIQDLNLFLDPQFPATGWTIIAANAINEYGGGIGQIVASATTPTNGTHAVLLTPNIPPMVTVTAASSSIVLGETLPLNGTATDPDSDPIIAWTWNVDSKPLSSTDPNILTQDAINPNQASFNPDASGNYTFSLLANDGLNDSIAATIDIVVADNLLPTAVASPLSASGFAPLTVFLDGSTSTDPEGYPLTYNWDFGDGSIGSGASLNHTYSSVGNYTAILTVTDNIGQIDQDTVPITVNTTNTPPSVNPTASPNSGEAPLLVTLSANASDPDAGAVLTYEWDFGDGTPKSTANPITHTFTAAGVYTVKLVVADEQLATTTAQLTVSVQKPAARFDLNINEAKVKLKKHGTKSKLKLKGTFTPSTPAASDTIRLTFDRVEILSAPLSNFVSAGADNEDDNADEDGLDDDDNPSKYKLKLYKGKFEIDFAKGRFELQKKHLDLSGFDPGNNPVVELTIGNATGLDSIQLSGKKKEFEHHAH